MGSIITGATEAGMGSGLGRMLNPCVLWLTAVRGARANGDK
jgi:hypothetical protein